MSNTDFFLLNHKKKSKAKKICSSSPNTSFETLISESKSACWTELTDLDEKGDKTLTKELYLSVQQLFFQENNEINNYHITCFIQTKNAELLLATNRGQIGILERNDTETKWKTISRICSPEECLDHKDYLYDDNLKLLIDVCLDDKSQLFLLTKQNQNQVEFYVESYKFDESKLEIELNRIFNLTQILPVHLLSNHLFEFVRICYDSTLDLFVLIDEKEHKIYWCNPVTFKAKKSIYSSDSIYLPNSFATIDHYGSDSFCLSSQKGIVIRKLNQEAVLHEVPANSIPLDITYSREDKNIYFIDKFNLYRSRLNDTNNNLLRYRKLFSNHESLVNKTGFSRVIRIKDWFYLMIKDENSLVAINVKDVL